MKSHLWCASHLTLFYCNECNELEFWKIVHLLYTQMFECLYLVTFQEELATSFADFSNTLEFITLASDFEPGNSSLLC
jgi:hypothetical protein